MTNPSHLLLFEDNPDCRLLIKRELRREFSDLQVTEILDSQGLVQALEAGGFDAVITDYQLRWTTGLEVLHTIKAHNPDCPVIMCTATGSEEIAVEAMKAGLDDYVIKKPAHLVRLPAALRAAWEKVQHRKALKRMEESLRHQKELLQTIFDHIPVMINLFDPDGRLKMANRAWERILGWSLEELRNIDFLAELYPDPAYRQQVIEFIQSTSTEWADFRTRVRDGRVIDTMWTNVRLSDGTNIGIGQDITERKRTERELQRQTKELKAAHQRLAALSRQVQEARESEQRRLARELHDEFAQSLVALKMMLSITQHRIEQRAEATLTKEVATVDHLIKQVRDITRLLRPPLLDELGLVPALRAHAEQQSRMTGLAIHVRADPPTLELPPLLETTIFRLIQEILGNAIRHARAQRVEIALHQNPSELTLLARDDGIGFDVQAAQQRAERGETLGLIGMQERVQLVGGTWSIHSAPSKGAEVRVCLPLQRGACDPL